MRQTFVASRLAQCGHEVMTLGLSPDNTAVGCTQHKLVTDIDKKCDMAVLPIVASSDGINISAPFSQAPIPLSCIAEFIRPNGLVFGGMISDDVKALYNSLGLNTVDYFLREELIIKNCIPTAEGALQIAMEELPKTIFNSEVIILGFGRVAKATASVFKALGAKVHIAARSYTALAQAEILGYDTFLISSLTEKLKNTDIVINTIPAVIMSRPVLSTIDRNTLILDLASKPGGVDFDTAAQLDLKVIWALSLPLDKKVAKNGGANCTAALFTNHIFFL